MSAPDEGRIESDDSPACCGFLLAEWRRQRRIWHWLALPLMVCTFALPALGRLFPSWQSATSGICGPLLLILGVALVSGLGAKTFAGDRDPAFRNRRFWGKFAFCLLLILPILLLFCAALAWRCSPDELGIYDALHYAGFYVSGDVPIGTEDAAAVLAGLCLGAVLLLSAAALAASCGVGFLPTALASAVLGALAVCWMFRMALCSGLALISWHMAEIQSLGRVIGDMTWMLIHVVLLSLTPAPLLLGAWWCWAGAPRRLRARLVRFVLALVVATAIPSIPIAAITLRVMCFATPGDYLRHHQNVEILPSAGGHFLSVSCTSSAHSNPDSGYADYRVAIVNAGTGAWRWVDRFHQSSFPFSADWQSSSSISWSPEGKRCLFVKWHALAIPCNSNISLPCSRSSVLLFDAATDSLSPADPQLPDGYAGWLDDATLYAPGIPYHFLNIDTGKTSACAAPPALVSLAGEDGKVVVAGKGVYFSRTGQGDSGAAPVLAIARFHPDLPVAEYSVFSHNWRKPTVADISLDGRFALVYGWSEKEPTEYGNEKTTSTFYIASLDDGRVIDAPPPEDMPALRPWADAAWARFLHDGRRFGIPDQYRLRVCDIASGQWTTLQAAPTPSSQKASWTWPQPQLSPNRRYVALPTPAGDALVTLDLDTGSMSPLIELPNARYLRPMWLGNDRLIITLYPPTLLDARHRRANGPRLFVVNRHGAGQRELFPDD